MQNEGREPHRLEAKSTPLSRVRVHPAPPPMSSGQVSACYCLKPHSTMSMEQIEAEGQQKDPSTVVTRVQGRRMGLGLASETPSRSLPAGLGLHFDAAPATLHQCWVRSWGWASVH